MANTEGFNSGTALKVASVDACCGGRREGGEGTREERGVLTTKTADASVVGEGSGADEAVGDDDDECVCVGGRGDGEGAREFTIGTGDTIVVNADSGDDEVFRLSMGDDECVFGDECGGGRGDEGEGAREERGGTREERGGTKEERGVIAIRTGDVDVVSVDATLRSILGDDDCMDGVSSGANEVKSSLGQSARSQNSRPSIRLRID